VTRVAFLGLGTMGAPMAANVLRRGFPLTVWNRTADRAAPLTAAGARAASSPAECARGADIVVLMLADPPAVDAVVGAMLDGVAPGALVVDMSTVDPACARRTAAALAPRGARYVDAPVSGTRKPAVDGTLLVMAGGAPEDVERARPVLEAMGRLVRVGDVGHGMAMKLVLNGLGVHMLTGLQALIVLGRKLGLDGVTMLDVIGRGAFSSPLFQSKGARILDGDFAPDFTVKLLRKDQALVLETARALGYPMPTEEVLAGVLDDAIAAGLGDDDIAGTIRLFERWAGTAVRRD
jgi:3-hydroxyisobutyrate dehydrogenase-like beta-hydroxyacid dehydrogenase